MTLRTNNVTREQRDALRDALRARGSRRIDDAHMPDNDTTPNMPSTRTYEGSMRETMRDTIDGEHD